MTTSDNEDGSVLGALTHHMVTHPDTKEMLEVSIFTPIVGTLFIEAVFDHKGERVPYTDDLHLVLLRVCKEEELM